ncbi:MAG TPA: methyltransferase domain-containing protein [Abditibacteriaceae bacterium]|jgi:SAM-dependent methyltransferase
MINTCIKSIKNAIRPLYRRFVSINPVRREVAARYLNGNGIEIGALHFPLEVPRSAHVRYLDRMTVAQLRQQYPELQDVALVDVDIVDDGEFLPSMPATSQDFVVANHMIEHCQNPIASIENWLRVLKPGGILYMAVPDKRYTFDVDRDITSLEHLVRDYREGPAWSRATHFKEAASQENKTLQQIEAYAAELQQQDYSIHFHVWTQAEILELLIYCRNKLSFPFDIELFQKNGIEFIVVLRKEAKP